MLVRNDDFTTLLMNYLLNVRLDVVNILIPTITITIIKTISHIVLSFSSNHSPHPYEPIFGQLVFLLMAFLIFTDKP